MFAKNKKALAKCIEQHNLTVPNALTSLFSLEVCIGTFKRNQIDTQDHSYINKLKHAPTPPSLKDFKEEFAELGLDSRFFQDLMAGKPLGVATGALRYRVEAKAKTGIFEHFHALANRETLDFQIKPIEFGSAKNIVRQLSVPSVGLTPDVKSTNDAMKTLHAALPNYTEAERKLALYSSTQLTVEQGLRKLVKDTIGSIYQNLKPLVKIQVRRKECSELSCEIKNISSKRKLRLSITMNAPQKLHNIPSTSEILTALQTINIDWNTLNEAAKITHSPEIINLESEIINEIKQLRNEAKFTKGMFGFTEQSFEQFMLNSDEHIFSFVDELTNLTMQKLLVSKKDGSRLLKLKEKVLLELVARGRADSATLIERKGSAKPWRKIDITSAPIKTLFHTTIQSLIGHNVVRTNYDLSKLVKEQPEFFTSLGKTKVTKELLLECVEGSEFAFLIVGRPTKHVMQSHPEIKLAQAKDAFSNEFLLKGACPRYFDLASIKVGQHTSNLPYLTKNTLSARLQFGSRRAAKENEIFHHNTPTLNDTFGFLNDHGVNPFGLGLTTQQLINMMMARS